METVQPAKKISPTIKLTMFLKGLSGYFHQGGGSSASTSYFRGGQNKDLGRITSFLEEEGYSLKNRRNSQGMGTQTWTKVVGKPYGDSSNLRSHHNVDISHNGVHVYNVQHLVSAY